MLPMKMAKLIALKLNLYVMSLSTATCERARLALCFTHIHTKIHVYILINRNTQQWKMGRAKSIPISRILTLLTTVKGK